MTVATAITGLVVTEHELPVPLDHARPGGETLTLFAREVADPEGRDHPFLVFLQGGPGNEAPRPMAGAPGWLPRALRDFRVLMLDQRGTGRSSPIGTLSGLTPAEQAERLSHFRADAIVRDAELLRAALGVERWSLLGQSFGGFCVLTYLSLAPASVREAFVTGGLAPFGPGRIDDVYRATFARAADRSRRYLARYPGDRARVRELHEHLAGDDVRLPSGDRLSPRRLRQLGALLGQQHGFERLHHVLELPPRSPAFLHDVEAALPWARNPLYAVLNEASWADGGATRWAAQRLLPDELVSSPEGFTAEHVFPWMFEEIAGLAPLREAAELLAQRDWPRLYDPERLAHNEVPVAAAIYAEDLYVPRAPSEETAARVGGLRPWLTSEYEHDGLRASGDHVIDRLIALARGPA